MGWLRSISNSTPPPRRRVRSLVLRLIGIVTSVAFASLYSQVLVLYGERGLLPVAAYLDGTRATATWFDMYWFTGWEEGQRTGAWWRRELQRYSRTRERF